MAGTLKDYLTVADVSGSAAVVADFAISYRASTGHDARRPEVSLLDAGLSSNSFEARNACCLKCLCRVRFELVVAGEARVKTNDALRFSGSDFFYEALVLLGRGK